MIAPVTHCQVDTWRIHTCPKRYICALFQKYLSAPRNIILFWQSRQAGRRPNHELGCVQSRMAGQWRGFLQCIRNRWYNHFLNTHTCGTSCTRRGRGTYRTICGCRKSRLGQLYFMPGQSSPQTGHSKTKPIRSIGVHTCNLQIQCVICDHNSNLIAITILYTLAGIHLLPAEICACTCQKYVNPDLV